MKDYNLAIPMNEDERARLKKAAKTAGYTIGGLTKKLLMDFVKTQEAEANGTPA